MPKPGRTWRHVQINTYCSWLKGDRRGFRAKGHEIHSSGDYRNPPPTREHSGLRRYFAESAKKEVRIPLDCRPIIGRALLRELDEQRLRVLAIACAKVHAHVVVELPNGSKVIRGILGQAKRKSSRAVKNALPGKVWSRGEHAVLVLSKDHLSKAFDYVLYEQGHWAWTWSFRDATDDGQFARKRPPRAQRRAASS